MLHKEEMAASSTWNIGDPNLLIPVVGSNDSVGNNVIVESLGESSQMSASSLGQTFLIGLNKSFFEQASCSKDVIFIQNSDLKLPSDIQVDVPAHGETTSAGYLISFVESSKVASWENLNKNVRRAQKDVFDASSNSSLPSNDLFLTQIKRSESQKTIFESELTSVIGESLERSKQDGLDCIENDIEKSLPSTFVQKKGHTAFEYSNHFSGKDRSHLPEQSLPLKKKAKMKGSDVGNYLDKEVDKKLEASTVCDEKHSSARSEQEIAVMKDLARRKRQRMVGKRKCCYSDSELSEEEEETTQLWNSHLDINELASMGDLVNHLRINDLIDDYFADLIRKGVSEMKVDIFEELRLSCSNSVEPIYSYELLAFAFLLYFQKREVYNYLNCCLDYWPSISKLKEWRNLVNSKPKKRAKTTKKETPN